MNIRIVLAFLLLPLCAAFPGEWCDGKFVRLPTNEEDVSEIHFCTKPGNGVEFYNITDEFGNILMDGVEIACVETAARLADVVVRRAKDEPVTLTVTPDGHLILSTSVESRILRNIFFFDTCFVPIKRCPTGQVMLVPKVEGEEYTFDLCGRMDVAWDFYLKEKFSEDTYEASELMVWCNTTMAEIVLHPGWAGRLERETKQPIVMRATYDNGHPKLYIGEEVVEKYSLSDNSYTCLTERLIARDNFFTNDTVKHECAGQLLRYPTTAGEEYSFELCSSASNEREYYTKQTEFNNGNTLGRMLLTVDCKETEVVLVDVGELTLKREPGMPLVARIVNDGEKVVRTGDEMSIFSLQELGETTQICITKH